MFNVSCFQDDPKFRDLISKSETARKALERDKRKKETVERKKTDKQIKICNLIKVGLIIKLVYLKFVCLLNSNL